MTLDGDLVRLHPDAVAASERARGRPEEHVQLAAQACARCRELAHALQLLRAERRLKLRDAEESRRLKPRIEDAERSAEEAQREAEGLLRHIGNLLHPDVPVGGEDRNRVLRVVDRPPQRGTEECAPPPAAKGPLRNHVEIMAALGLADCSSGARVAGSRGYFLRGQGVFLCQALQSFALRFAAERGYEPLATPLMMRSDAMRQCAQLEQFDQELYAISSVTAAAGAPSHYLIATSEQPMCAMHQDRWFESATELPVRMAGVSTCFRREAGSHGRDTLGLFRTHQFDKVELFCVAHPARSWDAFSELLSVAEALYAALGLTYRVVNVASQELNNAASMKHDVEAWFPAGGSFRELVSCTNCTDYQARDLQTRLRLTDHELLQQQQEPPPQGQGRRSAHVHMLNCTLVAVQRTLCCLLENYQTPDGVVVPPALRPYMGGVAFLPWKKGCT